jgi:UDP-N-acetylmuramate dehydrogenase
MKLHGMHIEHKVALKGLTTFGIDVVADEMCTLTDLTLLPELSAIPVKYIIGGGSNILCTQAPKGLVILNRTKGIRVLHEDAAEVLVEVASGEVWHEFVLYALAQGWNGIENLALIPGTVGAAPIQNIGAYGVEVKDCIDSVNYWDWQAQKLNSLSHEECQFAYRESIFKHELKDRFFISSVVFRLSKQMKLHTTYGAIEEELKQMNILSPNAQDVADAVMRIRRSKLPDPKVVGNAGSFFKNPTVSLQQLLDLKKQYPSMPSFPVTEQLVKVPAAWLIEQCGWKGYRKGDYGVHTHQALVLVNYAAAAGADIWQLSSDIVASVQARFGISLEREVQVW